MRSVIICISLFMIIACPCVRAQDNFKFSSYTVDDGLPQSSIWSILQDKNGFLWVGTADGLCRFDGYEFTVFREIDGDTNSISGKSNMHFFEDAAGNIWIAHDKGITKYDLGANKFINIYRYKNLPQSSIFNRVLGQDKDGNVWVGIVNEGLLKINSRTNKITETISSGDSALADESVWFSGFIDKKQRIWFTKRINGLYCYDIAHNKFEKYLNIYQGNAITPFGNSSLLMSSKDKLIVFDCETQEYSEIDQSHWEEDLKVKNEVNNIAPDNKNHLWFCNQNGAYVFDTGKKKVIKRFSSFSQGTNNYSYCYTAYCDHSGNIWIGTNGDGLKKLMNDTKGFRDYSTHVAGGTIVKSIYVHNSILYVGCFDNGIDVFNMDTGFIKKIDAIDGRSSTCLHNVYAMGGFDNNNALIYSSDTRGNNIGLFNFHTYSFTSLLPQLIRGIKPGIDSGGNSPFIVNTKKGAVFGWNSNLVLLGGTDQSGLNFLVIHKFEQDRLTCCYEGHKGLLYVGTTTGFYLQNEKNNWIKGALPEQQYVKTICEDSKGDIWVGTTDGIYVFNDRNKLLIHYDVRNGLKNEFIYGILQDNRGRMWFSHNKGISVYDPANNSFHNYTSEDGLQSNEFNTGAYCKLANGTMLFGGINGVNAFNPDSVKNNPNKPPVVITGISVFDEPLKMDTAYWYVHSLTLPYDKNSLTFDFTALEFTNPHMNQYEYKMEGLDNNWIKAGEDHRARYSALQPGKYTFKVKASNNDGVWQELPAIIHISIVPPFWQQWWFRMLYALLFIAFLSGIILLIQMQRHKRQIRELELQQKIQLERERISRDLHDNVGTQLSLISNNIEWVAHPLKKISESEKAEKLQFVNNTARGIIATLRETIWALNKEQISLEEFSDKLKAFVQKQMVLYPQTSLNFVEQIDEAIILGPSEALNLFRICQEAVANSLKYADAALLDISVQSIDGKYRIIIADDGKGFDINAVDPSVQNGLENMKFRAKDIQGRLEIVSGVGNGTTVRISKQ